MRTGRRVACVTLVWAVLAAASVTGAVPARAQTLVTMVATGTIDRVDFDLRGRGVEVGDPFTVHVTYDADATDLSPSDPTRGDYDDPVTDVDVQIQGTGGTFTWGAHAAPGDTLTGDSVVFDGWNGGADQWWLQAQQGWSGDTMGDYQVHWLQRFIDISDSTATAFSSDALPTSPPAITGFDSPRFTIVMSDGGFTQWLAGYIETLTENGPEAPPVEMEETITVGDAVAVLVELTIDISEAITVSDAVAVLPEITLAIDEVITVDDGPAVLAEVTIQIPEGVVVTDAVSITISGPVTAEEGISVTDAISIVVREDVDLGETIAVDDDVSVTIALSRTAGILLDVNGQPATTFFGGDTARLTGDGFEPRSTVEIELRSDPIPLGSTTADASGAIDVQVVLPIEAPFGEHSLVAVGFTPDGIPHEVFAALTLLDPSPVITDVDEPTPVQVSDGLSPVTIRFEDPNSDAGALSASATGLPAGVALGSAVCDTVEGTTTCGASIAGRVAAPAGTYEVDVLVSDGTSEDTVTLSIVVVPEDGAVSLASGNPVAVSVQRDGTSGPVTLRARIAEAAPDEGFDPGPIDLGAVSVVVTLAPVGPGPTVTPACVSDTSGHTLEVTCNADDLPAGTYVVRAALDDVFMTGWDEDVLTVSDPDAGGTTGGGVFLWPGTGTASCDGDRTTFGFSMEHNKKGTNVKGTLLMIRHRCEGGLFRIKSNALDGLAVGETDDGVPWASFSGKATFLAPWMSVEEGNHSFTAYVEDGGPAGADDRFWIRVKDKDGATLAESSLAGPAATGAIGLAEGDVVVPAPRRRGKR